MHVGWNVLEIVHPKFLSLFQQSPEMIHVIEMQIMEILNLQKLASWCWT